MAVLPAILGCEAGGEGIPSEVRFPVESGMQSPSPEQVEFELSILTALNAEPGTGVRYEPSPERVVITIYGGGEAVQDSVLDRYRDAAIAAAGDIPVVFEVEPSSIPTLEPLPD